MVCNMTLQMSNTCADRWKRGVLDIIPLTDFRMFSRIRGILTF